MKFTGKYLPFAAVLLAALLVCSCRREQPVDVIQGKGCIVLSLAAEDLITCDTKAAVDLSGVMGAMTFTVSGTRRDGSVVDAKSLVISGGSAMLEAGTYILTVMYEPEGHDSGNGLRCYSGTSETFTVNPGEISDVSVHLTVSNTSVTVVTDPLFDAFYRDAHVEFTQPRSVTVFTGTEVFLPAGETVFNITATALDNTSAGGKNVNLMDRSISFDRGTANTITLKAAPDGTIIFTSSTTDSPEEIWNEEFS